MKSYIEALNCVIKVRDTGLFNDVSSVLNSASCYLIAELYDKDVSVVCTDLQQIISSVNTSREKEEKESRRIAHQQSNEQRRLANLERKKHETNS